MTNTLHQRGAGWQPRRGRHMSRLVGDHLQRDQLHVPELEWSPTDKEEYLNLVSPLLTSKVTVSVLGLGLGAHILVDGQITTNVSTKPSVDARSPRPPPCEELEWSPTDGEEYLNLVSPLLISKVTVTRRSTQCTTTISRVLLPHAYVAAKPFLDAGSPSTFSLPIFSYSQSEMEPTPLLLLV